MDDLRGHLVLLRKEDQRGREDQSYRKDADTGSLMKGLLKQPLGWASVVCTWLVYNPPFSGDCICWGSLSTRRDHQFDCELDTGSQMLVTPTSAPGMCGLLAFLLTEAVQGHSLEIVTCC